MKRLLAILGGGFLVFVAVAMVQEWETFAQPWFPAAADPVPAAPRDPLAAPGDPATMNSEAGARGAAPPPADTADSPDGRRAEVLLRRFFALSRHLYASGGDPRFAERLPASEGVLRELLDDIAYLARNRRLQDPTLVELQLEAVEPLSDGRLEARTREYWVVRTRSVHGEAEVDPPRSLVFRGRYLLAPDGDGLRVEAWDVQTPEAP